MDDVPPYQRNLALVFQTFAIFPHMNVWNNVEFGLKMRNVEKEARSQKVRDVLRLMGLEDVAHRPIIQLSRGQLQRVGLARALVIEPEVILLDEPLGSLDPKVSKVFRHELRNLIKDLGLTAIHVTHNQEEAMAIADKIILMRAGRILQMGTPYELYENPRSIFVANFLGETNFLQGFVLKILENEKMKVWIRLGGPKIICNNSGHKFNLDDNIVISFRFEDVYLFPKDYNFKKSPYDWSKIQFFETILENTRFIGPTKRFYLTIDSGDNFLSVKPGTFEENFNPGDLLIVGIHIEDVHVFPAPKDLIHELSLM